MDEAKSPNCSRIGSTRWECAATPIRRRRVSTPWPDRRRSRSDTASRPPATIQRSGLLTTAMDRSSPRCCSNSAGDRGTLSIPPGGSDSNKSPRNATSATASSRVITPARHAAVYSPRLCPIMRSGFNPKDSRSRAMAYSVANRAGRAYAGRSRSPASASPSTRRRRLSLSGAALSSAHRSNQRRYSGSVAYRRAPIPTCCAPPPGNMKSVWRSVMTSGERRPSRVPRMRAALAPSRATTVRRLAW